MRKLSLLLLLLSLGTNAQKFGATVGANSKDGYNLIGANYTTSKGLFIGAAVADREDTKGVLSIGYLSTEKYGVYISSDFYINNKLNYGMSLGYKVDWFVPSLALSNSEKAIKVLIILN